MAYWKDMTRAFRYLINIFNKKYSLGEEIFTCSVHHRTVQVYAIGSMQYSALCRVLKVIIYIQ